MLILKVVVAMSAVVVPMPLQQPAAAPGINSPAEGCLLSVHVEGFRNHKGVLGCAVYKTAQGWPEKDAEAYARAAISITQDNEVIKFENVSPGRYGIAVLHDENSNHRMDRNLFGVPKEGFGFANNPRVAFSAPSWKDSSVEVGCPATDVSIHLTYK